MAKKGDVAEKADAMAAVTVAVLAAAKVADRVPVPAVQAGVRVDRVGVLALRAMAYRPRARLPDAMAHRADALLAAKAVALATTNLLDRRA